MERSGGEQRKDSEAKDIIWTKTEKRDGKGGQEKRYWELTTKRSYKKKIEIGKFFPVFSFFLVLKALSWNLQFI